MAKMDIFEEFKRRTELDSLRVKPRPIQINQYPLSLIVRVEDGNGGLIYYPKRTTPFRPYVDPFIDTKYNPYREEPKSDIEEHLIETLVNKVITNQAVSLAEGTEYYENFENTFYDEDKVPEMYKIRSSSGFYLDDKALPKKNQQQNSKRGRKKKSKGEDQTSVIAPAIMFGELPAGSEQFTRADGTKMITLSVNMIRQYMFSEVEVRVRHVTEYYRRQWEEVNRERMQALADLINSQELALALQKDNEELDSAMVGYKVMCTRLLAQISDFKEAKKRKRQAKKNRKSESLSVCNYDGDENENEPSFAQQCRDENEAGMIHDCRDENEASLIQECREVFLEDETWNTNNNGEELEA